MKRNNERGVALILTMVLVLAISVMAVSLALSTDVLNVAPRRTQQSTKAGKSFE